MRDFAIRELPGASGVQVADINRAIRDHLGWFRQTIGRTNCSVGFIIDLAWHTANRSYNVHAILDEIAILEGKLERKSLTKRAAKFRRRPLTGLWHKHHNQACYMAENILIEINKPGNLESKLARFMGMPVGDVLGELTQEIVDVSYRDRAKGGRLTGEFIVFERDQHGRNYYLTLGSHGKDCEIVDRIEFYRTLDAEARSAEATTSGHTGS